MLSIAETNYPVRYDAMRKAILECASIDECKAIKDRATAMAIYFKQVRDDDSVRKMNEIKFRSLRRLGELLQDGVDFSECDSQKSRIERMRAVKGDLIPKEMTDHYIIQAIQVANIPGGDFEQALPSHLDRGGVPSLIRHADPVFRERITAQEEERASERAKRLQKQDEYYASDDFKRAQRVKAAEDQATKQIAADEVGLTLMQEHRRPMKSFAFLLKLEAHEQLREAAHDKRMTMHEILRQSLDMWFLANGLPPLANHDMKQPDSDAE